MIINLLANNGYIVLNKTLMKKVGLYEAILIGELSSEQIYWERRNELIDGFFFSTRENLEEQTLLSSHQQRIAIENLKKAGILEVKLFGMPQKAINPRNIYIIVSRKYAYGYIFRYFGRFSSCSSKFCSSKNCT